MLGDGVVLLAHSRQADSPIPVTLKRGRLVGETTGGGAHHNQMVRVGGHFVMSVPTGTVESPVTHTNWETIGVKPDVAVAADRAVDVALAEARKMLGQH